MKIIFHDKFYETDYAHDGAAESGRIESIMESIDRERTFEIIHPEPADEEKLLLAHSQSYINTVRPDTKRYNMAVLAAGAAIMAAETGFTGEPAFAVVRPPGHHASHDSAWGYCVFCNMGIALLNLKEEGKIKSAFILDFDAHTGDGTKAVLSDWKECRILNPYEDNSTRYIEEIRYFIKEITSVDIIGVCAGFDSYEKDIGRKLSTHDYYTIGVLMKEFSQKLANGRRFAILEGGYYQPDLGKNVTAFCKGFSYGWIDI
jgi:acetoin utilization deacetylase AcuC-like enzyme